MVCKVEGRIIAIAAFVAMILSGCNDVQEHTAPAIRDRDSASVMTSYGVNTLISDSGVIKYKIITERWDVNTMADTAWYFDQQKLWHLRGRVKIRNINGLLYESEELYWDGVRHELYSNVFSKVTTPERNMEGTYFLSDERMTHYTVSNSKGSFTREDMTGESKDEDKDKKDAKQDTVQAPQPMRQQLQKHRRTGQ